MSLTVESLSYSYGAKPALEDVSFSVAGGQFAALLGPNGAGKSTVFALATRLFATQSGTVSVAGNDLSASPLKALAALGVVFQRSTLDLDLTVRQNLRYFAPPPLGSFARVADRCLVRADAGCLGGSGAWAV